MAYQEPKPRSIRLDDDVYEALKKLPESPNKFLRRVLSAGGVFEPEVVGVVEGDHVRVALKGATSKADRVVRLPRQKGDKTR